MKIRLIKPKDLNGMGKVLPAGIEIEVMDAKGYAMIEAGEAENLVLVVKGSKKVGTKNIHTRKIT